MADAEAKDKPAPEMQTSQGGGFFMGPKMTQEDMERALKVEIEREFRNGLKRCVCCQRPGEWKLKCGRCKKAYYCGRECQKWHWNTHKQSCVPFGEAPPPKPKPRPKPPPDDDDDDGGDLFDLTDDQLRVSYLEGCGNVDAAAAHVRRRWAARGAPVTAALVTGHGRRRCVMELPGRPALDVEDVLRGHARPALLEMAKKNPKCALSVGATGKARRIPPLTASPPSFPSLLLDDAIPMAFVGFSGLDEAAIKALADGALLDDLAGSGPVAAVAGYDGDGGLPVPCKGLETAVLVRFTGLGDARPALAPLYATVHGRCRNNVVAAAVAKKALFYALEADDRYASPVDGAELLVNSRGVPVDTAALFRTTRLDEAAAMTEAEIASRFRVDADVPS